MRFYQQQHPFYCGVDLHARTMHVCVVDQPRERHASTRISRLVPTTSWQLIAPYRESTPGGRGGVHVRLVLAGRLVLTIRRLTSCWAMVLYMKAIHGGKTKNDKLDSEKMALFLRGGMLPVAYAYPKEMRATRDLLRRRMRLMHVLREAPAKHVVNTTSQYNLPPMATKITVRTSRIERAWPRSSPTTACDGWWIATWPS